MISLLLVAFAAGILTVLAPCVLPLLPVIVGGSLAGSGRSRPYVIVASLAVSLFVFTLILKVSSSLLGIPAAVWTTISGGIIVVLGIVTIWPGLYDRLSAKTGFLNSSQQFLGRSGQNRTWIGPVLIGAALGPVFASCSPTYALIIATVLPASFSRGVVYLLVYLAGLSVFMLTLALVGRRILQNVRWAVDPHGWFKRSLGVLFVLIGIAILFGFDKTAENWLIDHQLFDATQFEQQLLPTPTSSKSSINGTKSAGVHFAISDPKPAPELVGLTGWINSNPQTIASLKGKVVLIDFWTYSCINCIHTLPHVQAWYDKYQRDGLVVLGIHSPEFAFERIPANVAQAVKDDHLTYPVAQDNDMATWRAFSNQYWPAEYFIDRQGRLRHYHFGEGNYDETEAVIRALLAEDGTAVGGSVQREAASQPSAEQSPETYLGSERAARNQNPGGLKTDTAANYSFAGALAQNGWALSGNWTVGAQDTRAGTSATLRYKFSAKQVYLVMGSAAPSHVKVLVNGRPVSDVGISGADVSPDGTATVSGSRLYRLVNSPDMLHGATLELQFDSGVIINAFTFDS